MQSNVIFRKTPLKPTKNLHYISFMHHFPVGAELDIIRSDMVWKSLFIFFMEISHNIGTRRRQFIFYFVMTPRRCLGVETVNDIIGVTPCLNPRYKYVNCLLIRWCFLIRPLFAQFLISIESHLSQTDTKSWMNHAPRQRS